MKVSSCEQLGNWEPEESEGQPRVSYGNLHKELEHQTKENAAIKERCAKLEKQVEELLTERRDFQSRVEVWVFGNPHSIPDQAG